MHNFDNFTATPPYLLVNNVKDIKSKEGQMSIPDLLRGINAPVKRKLEGKIAIIILFTKQN